MQAGSDECLFDRVAGVVLARAAVGDTDHVQVAAQVGLGAVLPAHERADGAQAGADRQPWLRLYGGVQDVPREQIDGIS